METAQYISSESKVEIAKGLGRLLADTYTLYLKTHNFHWNVRGPMFQTLHTMFETQYTELAAAVDLIAERIRALGERAPGSYQEFAKLTSVKEAVDWPDSRTMIRELAEGHDLTAGTARGLFVPAEKGGDQVTLDLLTQRLQVHEKTAWMLKALIEG